MPTVGLRSSAGEFVLNDEECTVLLWLWNLAAHLPQGSGGDAVSRLVVAGGEFNRDECSELLAFCRVVREQLLAKRLEVRKPKYTPNACLGSEAGYRLVLQYKCAYANLNTADHGVFLAKRRQPDGVEAQTLGHLPPVRRALEALEAAAQAGHVAAEHSAPAEYV